MDTIVFPHMIVPLLVVDEKIINGIEQALNGSKLVLLLGTRMKSEEQEAIGTKDLYSTGTVSTIMRVVKLPNGGIKILVQGICKATVDKLQADDSFLVAKISKITPTNDNKSAIADCIKDIKAFSERINANGYSFSPDFHIIISKMEDPDKIADFILSHLNLKVEKLQELLEINDTCLFLKTIYKLLQGEVEVSGVQEQIRNNAREAMNQSQKEYYLREQLKAIKKELGEDDCDDLEVMRDKLATLPVSTEVREEINRQLNRLEKTAPDSMEATVTRNYLDWIFSLPWSEATTDILDLKHARKILDEDHYGLEEVKERILDFISVCNLKKDSAAPILCFAGPPGTGKTSLGKSIAKCLDRNYVRVSLGGIRDEAEIRGHRRTYVGAMPGRFIQGIRKAKSNNPVIIIDEIDKIGTDFRGDPSAAMLEVLDPHQNKTFYDNYLGVPFDLSKAIFIATANSLDTISEPLCDRMEIIHISGYTQEEKLQIARNYIVPRALKEAGLDNHHVPLSDLLLADIISSYTREAGVRQLERTIKKLCSKATRQLVEQTTIPEFTCANIMDFLGPKIFIEDTLSRENSIGICNGLAWTSYGGDIIKIEAVLMPGKGKLTLTGQLGDVMKESAQAALSYARAHAAEFKIPHELFDTTDLHIHVPAGAVPKDGPSAGITILSAILSAFTKRPIKASYAMTGELNLQGEVMPIGGVKEKVLAARRNGLKSVILPFKNQNELSKIKDIVGDLELIWVHTANEVLDHVLVSAT
jgi:ATP-dependent Lon protease